MISIVCLYKSFRRYAFILMTALTVAEQRRLQHPAPSTFILREIRLSLLGTSISVHFSSVRTRARKLTWLSDIFKVQSRSWIQTQFLRMVVRFYVIIIILECHIMRLTRFRLDMLGHCRLNDTESTSTFQSFGWRECVALYRIKFEYENFDLNSSSF